MTAAPCELELDTDFRPVVGTAQREVLAAALDPTVRLVLVEAGRGGGKTRVATQCALELALEWSGSRGFVVGPDYTMLTVDRDELSGRIGELRDERGAAIGHLVVEKENRLEHRLDFVSGSTVWLRSATDPGRFRGYELDWAVFDEAQKLASPAAYLMVRTCMRGPPRPWARKILLFSTVGERSSWLEDVRREAVARDDASFRYFRWGSAANPLLSREELDYQRGHLPADVWEREFEARRTTSAAGALFEHLAELVGGQADAAPRSAYAIGVDFGKARDFTVIAVLEARTGLVVEMDRFQGLDFPEVYARVAATWRRYGRPPVVADSGGMAGQVHVDVLREARYGVSVEGLSTNNRRRSGPVEALRVAFSRRAIRVPAAVRLVDGTRRELPAEVFAREARELIAEPRPDWTRYTHPAGGHDDTVVAVALAWSASARARQTAAPAPVLRAFAAGQPGRAHHGGTTL